MSPRPKHDEGDGLPVLAAGKPPFAKILIANRG